MSNAKHFFCGPTGAALCGVRTRKARARLRFNWSLVTCKVCLSLAQPAAPDPVVFPAKRATSGSTREPVCPFCASVATLAYGIDVFPHRPDLAEKPFWVCWPCDARVGCHPNTKEPLGTLANAALRRLRSEVHELLDRRWLSAHPRNRQARRGDTYAWLAKQLGLSEPECHVGMFDAERCIAALRALEAQARP